jgi:hypothetical protein
MKAIPVAIAWNRDLPIYASEPFLRTVSDEYGWLGGVDDAGHVVCVLPYSVITKSVFRLIRFPVQTILLKPDLNVDEERRFLNSAVQHFRSTGADLIIPAKFSTVFRTYPDGAVVAPYGNYIVDLAQSEEKLWQNVHNKHRNVIRNAVKKGVTIKSGIEYLETAYQLTVGSFMRSASGFVARQRLESRMDYANFSRQILALGDSVRVLVAEYEGAIQSAAIIPFSNHSAYYMHGGNVASPLTGTSNLLQWEAIRLFRELGVRHYDFFGARIDPEEGSKARGILKFKERFGGEFTRGYMWKCSFRPVKYGLYTLAARIRSGGDVVDQERHKLKSA